MRTTAQFQEVVLIDDDDTTNSVNERLLHNAGFAEQVHAETDCAQALRYLKARADAGQQPPDLILVDLKMQGRDGFWFLEQYHKRTNIQKARLVVALTSSASFYDLQKLKQFPEVVLHVYKPLTAEHLADLADRLSVKAA